MSLSPASPLLAAITQAGLHYRAIDTAMKQFQWERALRLAMQHKTHVDTVLYQRRKYMAAAGLAEPPGSDFHPETGPYAGIEIDEAAILAKVCAGGAGGSIEGLTSFSEFQRVKS